ncbi:MAG: hypothetical protein RIB32_01190 [Phycisphaerales bacterium]
MNWAIFAILSWFALGLDIGLASAISPESSDVRPSFFIPLIVFVAMRAPHRTALWAGLLGGLMLDLIHPLPRESAADVIIPGPHAIGLMLSAQLVVALRSMVMHRNPLTTAVLAFITVVVAGVVAIALLTIRTLFGDGIDYAPTHELLTLLGSALYTAVVALLLAIPLGWFAPVFSFGGHHANPGRFAWSHADRV